MTPQHKRILEKLNEGIVLTSLSALSSIGVYALSQRCGELIGKGYRIRRTPIKRTNRFGESVRITAYDIAPEWRNFKVINIDDNGDVPYFVEVDKTAFLPINPSVKRL